MSSIGWLERDLAHNKAQILQASYIITWCRAERPRRSRYPHSSDLTVRLLTLTYLIHLAALYENLAELDVKIAEWQSLEREWGGELRWASAHSVPGHKGCLDAVCQWCGKTIHSVEFNPRHADSRHEATAICHGLVEYHLMNGCEGQA